MKFGSLFSGIGGFDLGFEQAGMSCEYQVEIDRNCQNILRRRFANAKRFTDIRNVGAGNLEPVDVICGGFPCQDVSVSGNREGLAGKRSGLWYEYHRVIAETTPAIVVIENVTGLLSSNGGRDFAIIVQGLAQCGYSVSWRVLDSQYFGVAQRRRRVFIVGSLGDGRSAEILFEREGVSRRVAPSTKTRGIFADNARERLATGWDNQRFRIHDANGIAPTLAQSDSKGGNRTLTIAFDYNNGATQKGNITRAGDYVGCICTTHFDAIAFAPGNLKHNALENPSGIVGTLGAKKTGDMFPHTASGVIVRRLTPVECERLQGFPDNWTDGQSDSVRYKQLGNAVAVPCAKWIGERIMSVCMARPH